MLFLVRKEWVERMEASINKLLEDASEILAKFEQEKETGSLFNCVSICGVGTIETRHTEIIAALLDPQGNHGFGAESLKAFFRQCKLSKFAENCDDCYVQTEVKIPGRRPDIVIQGRNLCVVIENKTNTSDHYMQLADYRDWLEKQRVMYKKLLYLTYGGYPANDTNIKPEEYQSISYRETICNWLRECACMNNKPAADFCCQYADFIQKTLIPEGIINNNMTEKILENIDSFKAATCINKSFDNARFQILKNMVCGCWDGSEAVNADDKSCSIVLPGKSYKIAVQYDGGRPYYGICRNKRKADFNEVSDEFKIDGFESATAHWIAWKYIDGKIFQCNWSDADFLAEQWQKDNFKSFKKFINECIVKVKNALDDNSEKIDAYSSEM